MEEGLDVSAGLARPEPVQDPAEEDASMTDAERGAEDRLWEEFLKSLNATRAALGSRQL